MEERRQHQRQDKEIRVIVRANVPGKEGNVSETQVCAAKTRNISVGGLRLCTNTHFHLGTPLNLTLAWDDPPGTFELDGRVVWVREAETGLNEIGVRFTAGDQRRRDEWIACCKKSLLQATGSAVMDFITKKPGAQ